MHIKTSRFNRNAYSDEQCLIEFRFIIKKLPRMCELYAWKQDEEAVTKANWILLQPHVLQ